MVAILATVLTKALKDTPTVAPFAQLEGDQMAVFKQLAICLPKPYYLHKYHQAHLLKR